MIEKRPDWVLSRQRVWGVPLACFINKNSTSKDNNYILNDTRVNSRILKAFENEGADAWFSPGAKERFLKDFYNPDDYEKIDDILDVWFDSGSTHAFVLRDREDGVWPADLYLEGTDQHRGWFHSSLLQSCGTVGRAPYKGVLTHGFTLDEKGMKMSKSLGNTISPDDVIKQYGADILRLWVSQSDYTSDLRIGKEILKGVADSYRKLRNTMRFMISNLYDYDQNDQVTKVLFLDKAIISKTAKLQNEIRELYKEFNFHQVVSKIVNFCVNDLGGMYLDVIKDRLYTMKSDSIGRRSAQYCVNEILNTITKLISPILPFTAYEFNENLHPGKGEEI